MKPVRAADMNVVYRGDGQEIGDLWCGRPEPGLIESVWEPDEAERQKLAEGGRVRLLIFTEPIPPVALDVLTAEESAPVAEHTFHVPRELEERAHEQTPPG